MSSEASATTLNISGDEHEWSKRFGGSSGSDYGYAVTVDKFSGQMVIY